MTMTIEEFIRNNAVVPNPDNISGSGYEMKVSSSTNGELIVYFHPSGRDGDTVYYVVKGNSFTQHFSDTELMKANLIKERNEQK